MKKNKIRGCEEQPLLSMESKFPELKMSRIKSIIQKLFPPKQKTFNIFIAVYLALFVISLPEIFVYVGGEAVSGIWNTLAWFALWAVFIVFMLALPMYYKSRKRNLVFIPLLILLIFLYIIAVKSHRYTAGLLDVLYFPPVLITYILWNKMSANPVRNLIIFLAVPFSFVAFDKIVTLGFQLSCPFTTPEAEYNPIYLSRRFFHEENGKLVPNIKVISRYGTFKEYRYDKVKYTIPDTNNTIFMYTRCTLQDVDITDRLLKKGNIVLCQNIHSLDINYQKVIDSFVATIEKMEKGGQKVNIATLHSKILNKKYEKCWLRRLSSSYCRFGNMFGGNNVQFRAKELDYANYIKSLDKEVHGY